MNRYADALARTDIVELQALAAPVGTGALVMKVVYYFTYIMAFVFLVGETARRGIGYFSVNATTMIEDYLCGALLLWAAWVWSKGYTTASKIMAVAWAYATGGMFVPFAAHLEAWLRNETFRPDHPHTDLGSIVLKGVIWAVCLACLIVTLRSHQDKQSAVKLRLVCHGARQ